MKEYSLYDRILGSLMSAGVGDALGAPTEGFSKQEINSIFGRLVKFEDTSHNIISPDNNIGEVTDDSSQLVEMTKAMIRANGDMTIADGAQAILNWSRNWPKYYPRNAGETTRYVILALEKGENPVEIGKLGKRAYRGATNGAVMRIAPAGLVYPGDLDGACKNAIAMTAPSHGTQHGFAGACAIACAVAEAMTENSSVWSVMKATVYGAKQGQLYGEKNGRITQGPDVVYKIEQAMEVVLSLDSQEEIERKLQSVLGCDNYSVQMTVALALGMFAAANGDTMKTLEGCANIGGDTDTFACVAGMVAGAFNGCDGINPDLMKEFKQVNQNIDFEGLAKGLTKIAERRR